MKQARGKRIAVVIAGIMTVLLLSGCEGGASLRDFENFYLRPAYLFEVGEDDIQRLNVDNTLYEGVTETTGWLMQPEYYGKVIGYANYYMSINKIGLMEGETEQDFLYAAPEKGRFILFDLYAREGVEVMRMGTDTVSRIEYHAPDGNKDNSRVLEEVENTVADPEIIKAFFDDLFDPSNLVTEDRAYKESDVGALYLYSDVYPKFYVPDVLVQRAEDGRYFIVSCPFRWLTDYKDTFDVEISADVMEALIGPGGLE